MRLVSRSVVRELWPPFLLGFAAYTFILLIRTVYFLADFFVRRSASFGEVVSLAVLSLPWIVVLTLPMAFLLGVLIGIGRLAGDSEIVALRSCGVGPLAIYRPALAAAAVLSAGVFLLYNFILPGANERLSRSLARVAATSVVNVVRPRTFREARSGLTLYFDRAAADGRSLEGVFVKLGEEWEKDQRVIVARRGALTLEGDRLWLDLFNSTLHEYEPGDPSRYRTNRSQSQRVLVAGDIWSSPAANISYEKSLRSQSLTELAATARRVRRQSPENSRLAWVEIHKKLSIPFACLVFAVIGIPLAESARRGGRGSAFAISLAIIILYYVLLSSGETWAQQGRLPPGVAIWIPNAVLLSVGAAAIARSGRNRARWHWLSRRPQRTRATRQASSAHGRPRFGSLLRFPAILDRYVLARFFTILFLAVASVLLLAVIVDYADHVDKIAKNHPPTSVVLGYYRCFVLSIGMQIAPFVALIATLVSLGVLSKHNEDTAFRASGVSCRRRSWRRPQPRRSCSSRSASTSPPTRSSRRRGTGTSSMAAPSTTASPAPRRSATGGALRTGRSGTRRRATRTAASSSPLRSSSSTRTSTSFAAREPAKPRGTESNGSSDRDGPGLSAAPRRRSIALTSKTGWPAIRRGPSPGSAGHRSRCAGASSSVSRAV